MRQLDEITESMDISLSKFWETVKDRGDWCAVVHGAPMTGHDLMTKQQTPYSFPASKLMPSNLFFTGRGNWIVTRPSLAAFLGLGKGQKVKVNAAQSSLTLCDPMDHTVHGIL